MKSKVLLEVLIKAYFLPLVVVGLGYFSPGGLSYAQSANKSGASKPANLANPADIPSGPLGASIRLGLIIFKETPKYASAYVGNKLSCSDCHLQNGTAAYSSPMIGVPGMFPAYNARAHRVVTFEERVQECFVRSENGGRMIPADSPEMTALVAYMQWISRGQPAGQTPPGRGLRKLPGLTGDPVRGQSIYAKQCASCHGATGAGVANFFPPVWGKDSFNTGAGMDHPAKMAAFVQPNMPQNSPGSLTAQQAYDVSAYIDSQPHPPFNPAFKSY
ncbi:MAG: c-type cytochrome [Candidatus Dormibacteraceae bacterium]